MILFKGYIMFLIQDVCYLASDKDMKQVNKSWENIMQSMETNQIHLSIAEVTGKFY